MTVLGAQEIGRTYDCAWPGCDRESRVRGGYCDQGHVGVAPVETQSRRIAPGSLAHLIEDDPEPKKELSVPDPVLCRVDGCTRASVAQSGPWKGWCGEHKHLRGKKPEAATPARSAGRSEPSRPPAAPPPVPPVVPNPAARLQELVVVIEDRRNELIDLQAEALVLLDAIHEAISA